VRVLFCCLFLCVIPSASHSQKCSYRTDGPMYAPFGHEVLVMKGSTVRSIEGKVFDPTGLPLSEATVVLVRIDGEERKYIGSTLTIEGGRYCFGIMPDGRYRLEIGASGFNAMQVPLTVSSRSTVSGPKKIILPVGT